MGGKPQMHLVDGRQMTAQEIADMLGIKRQSLYAQRHRHKEMSMQGIVNLFRSGLARSGYGRIDVHMVDGRWMTAGEVAAELGVSAHNLQSWRFAHRDAQGNPVTLAEARDHYRRLLSGELKYHGGRRPRTFWVKGKQLTFAQAAAKYNTTESSLRKYVDKNHCTLNTAIRRLEERRKKKAVREIMAVIMEELK